MTERRCWQEGCDKVRIKWGMCPEHQRDWVLRYPRKATRIYGRGEAGRFWFYVDRVDVDDCWIWRGALDSGGYGVFNLDEETGGGQEKAHRYAFKELRGQIPDLLNGKAVELDHRCRVRPCVNPWHLQVVTQRGNSLLGRGFCAENARKTHCPKGHAYAGANLIMTPSGWRACRTCVNARGRERTRRGAAVRSLGAGEQLTLGLVFGGAAE